MELSSKLKVKYIDVFIVFVMLLYLFNFFVNKITLDYNEHLASIIKVNNNEAYYLPNFLFYYIVNLLSGFSVELLVLRDVTIVVLALATTIKFVLTKKLIHIYSEHIERKLKVHTVSIIAFCLLFAFSIPDFYNFFKLQYMYLGRIPPVVWHNSTLSLVFPFSILLFMHHLKMDKANNAKFLNKNNLILIVLAALNIFIKPSFIFVYIPVAGLLIIQKNGFKDFKKLIIRLLPLVICLLILFGQYVLIYFFQIGSFQKEESGVTIGAPFEFYRAFIPLWYLPLSILISYVYPILAAVFYKDILKFRPFVISICYTIVGLLIAAIMIESGPRRLHGNFTWQGIICSYILFLTTTMYLFSKLYTKERFTLKFLVLGIVFLLHFLSGLLYILKLFYTGYIS